MKNIVLTAICLGGMIAGTLTLKAETHTAVPMDEAHWTLSAEKYDFKKYLGVPSLYLPQGVAELNEVVFHNGIIEFDIAFPEGRGFPGIGFRIQDNMNYEEFYVRPHQSGNPDANQYTPIFNGLAGWQLYHGEGHGAAVRYKYDAWNHVKLIIKGTVGEVYINDMETPLFQILELKHGDTQGPIALKGAAESHFANFSYTSLDNPPLKLEVKELPKLSATTLKMYSVSEAIEDKILLHKNWLKLEEHEDLTWTAMKVEYTGTLNIAKEIKRAEGKNTALVKFTLLADSDQLKKLEFGYSDVVHVFVNGKIVYGGQRQFRSRDYRYLGTIGYFDAIYLDLKEGENEVVLAVTEAFGGWGIRAKLENLTGVRIP